MQTVDDALEKLSKSKFRSSFHLKQKDIDYIDEKGMEKIRSHANDFIKKNLAPAFISNDGKQTPMKNHPVISGSTIISAKRQSGLTEFA